MRCRSGHDFRWLYTCAGKDGKQFLRWSKKRPKTSDHPPHGALSIGFAHTACTKQRRAVAHDNVIVIAHSYLIGKQARRIVRL